MNSGQRVNFIYVCFYVNTACIRCVYMKFLSSAICKAVASTPPARAVRRSFEYQPAEPRRCYG